MDAGQAERITGYVAERSVERFFLLNGINARVCEFEAFDLLVMLDNSVYKCQIKGTTRDRFSVGSGRSRKVPYKSGALDFYALVQVDKSGKDRIWFLMPTDVAKQISISKLKISWEGLNGWERVKRMLTKGAKKRSTSSNLKESQRSSAENLSLLDALTQTTDSNKSG